MPDVNKQATILLLITDWKNLRSQFSVCGARVRLIVVDLKLEIVKSSQLIDKDFYFEVD